MLMQGLANRYWYVAGQLSVALETVGNVVEGDHVSH
jgi:hypothetical protein